jgi:hypothetical protein
MLFGATFVRLARILFRVSQHHRPEKRICRIAIQVLLVLRPDRQRPTHRNNKTVH